MTQTKSKTQSFITGQVVSGKSDKTVSVQVHRLVKHPRYGKYIKRRTLFKVHDGNNQAKPGDLVKICPVRPISKTKRWRLVEVVKKDERVAP